MAKCHFNQHPLISIEGEFLQKEEIYKRAVNQLYRYCHSRGYWRLWTYMWTNWYNPNSWSLWARSVLHDQLPVLKTTMIVESHWKQIKKRFLGDFNRPRIDLVFWILTHEVIHHHSARIDQIRSLNYRAGLASWRYTFKKDWTILSKKEVDPEARSIYHTDPYKWSCSCPSFLNSRFLICKHIVHCFEKMSTTNRVAFFDTVRRSRFPPFWVSDKLILRSEWRRNDDSTTVVEDEPDSLDAQIEDEMQIHEFDQTWVDVEEQEQLRIAEEAIQAYRDDLARSTDIMLDEVARGNWKYGLAYVKEHHPKIQTHLAERETLLASRRRPNTWAPHRHAATMYTS